MDKNDFIREIKGLMDRFFAEWLILNNEYEKSIVRDLKEMEKEYKEGTKFYEVQLEKDEMDIKLNEVVK